LRGTHDTKFYVAVTFGFARLPVGGKPDAADFTIFAEHIPKRVLYSVPTQIAYKKDFRGCAADIPKRLCPFFTVDTDVGALVEVECPAIDLLGAIESNGSVDGLGCSEGDVAKSSRLACVPV